MDGFLCIVCDFTFHSRIFHSYGDVTIIGFKLDLYSALMTIEQWGIFSVARLLWYGDPLHLHYFCALDNGAVTTCFTDLRLRPGIEPRSPAFESNDQPPSDRGCRVFHVSIPIRSIDSNRIRCGKKDSSLLKGWNLTFAFPLPVMVTFEYFRIRR